MQPRMQAAPNGLPGGRYEHWAQAGRVRLPVGDTLHQRTARRQLGWTAHAKRRPTACAVRAACMAMAREPHAACNQDQQRTESCTGGGRNAGARAWEGEDVPRRRRRVKQEGLHQRTRVQASVHACRRGGAEGARLRELRLEVDVVLEELGLGRLADGHAEDGPRRLQPPLPQLHAGAPASPSALAPVHCHAARASLRCRRDCCAQAYHGGRQVARESRNLGPQPRLTVEVKRRSAPQAVRRGSRPWRM